MKKKKLLIPVIASLVTVLVLSGVSYAYFSAKIKENKSIFFFWLKHLSLFVESLEI